MIQQVQRSIKVFFFFDATSMTANEFSLSRAPCVVFVNNDVTALRKHLLLRLNGVLGRISSQCRKWKENDSIIIGVFFLAPLTAKLDEW